MLLRILAPTLALAAAPAAADVCQIGGEALTPGDEERARAACERARSRFAGLMGDPVPAVLVLVQDRPGYRIGILDGQAVVLWPSSAAAAVQAAEAHVEEQWREALPHEIAHALTAARFFPDGRFEAVGYGTPLPDWFEEAVAIWAEPRPSRDRRLAAARELPARRLELATILTMSHPAAGDPAALAARDGAAPPSNAALWDFYQQSVAVLAFIHELGGQEAVRILASRLMAGYTGQAAVTGLPGLPGSFELVEAEWSAWLEASRQAS